MKTAKFYCQDCGRKFTLKGNDYCALVAHPRCPKCNSVSCVRIENNFWAIFAFAKNNKKNTNEQLL